VIRFRVLGPLEAVRDGVPVRLGGPRPRAVLAALLLAGGRPVRMDQLVDAVWGETPPDTAVKTVQKYVSGLRAQFGTPGPINSVADGYELAAPDTDVARFEELVDRAGTEATPRRVAAVLAEAMQLWRGEPYGELPDWSAAQAERRRLAERRLSAAESLAEARLALGEYGPQVGWLERLVADNPLRERLWALLMLALYRGGRPAEALAAYQRLRSTLAEELGTEPTAALRALHEEILRHTDAPPPRPGALPAHLTTFVGRDAELATLAAALAGNRLVTLTGPAGSGKTRLATELLAAQADGPAGTWFVELAGLSDPARVPSALAGMLRLGEQPGRELRDVLVDYFAGKSLLLVLDNCEHLLDVTADFVDRLLRNAPLVRVLATSRQPLGVAGEVVLDVPPLPVPATDDLAAVGAADAVRLLAQRARAVDGRFALTAANAAAVARIARRLDGIPLALELAAARLRVFDPATLADLLDDRFRVLVSTLRTAPARHQTLRAALAWSYDLLTAEEQAMFRALSVFEGGFPLAAAERVGGAAGATVVLLPALVERSLVVADQRAGVTRFRLLETAREYGRAQLDADESREIHHRHLAYHLDFAEGAANGIRGPRHADWLDRIDAERDNLQAALRWALTHGERATGLRLATALTNYWDERAQFGEGASALHEALAATPDAQPVLRSAGLAGAARMAIGLGDHQRAAELSRDSLAAARRAGDEAGVVRATALLGNVALYRADYAEGGRLLEESLAAYDRMGRRWQQAEVVGRLGHLNRLRGDFPAARAGLSRSLALRERLGDRAGQAWSLWQLGVLARYEGDYADAMKKYDESVAYFDDIGDAQGSAHVRYSMADVARLTGDGALADRLYRSSLRELGERGDQRCVASIQYNLGALALDRADLPGAAALFAQSLTVRRRLPDQAGIAECLDAFAAIAERSGDTTGAIRLLATSDGLRTRTGAIRPVSDQDAHTRRIATLRAAAGPAAFVAAWADGQDRDSDTVAADLLSALAR
jgi:predicted ATPase/DNA-binding SARP family transcriptional activator